MKDLLIYSRSYELYELIKNLLGREQVFMGPNYIMLRGQPDDLADMWDLLQQHYKLRSAADYISQLVVVDRSLRP